ncbi:monovalent cation/H+ antiporter subunit D family protein [Pseudenhygromyxa sp. WMMC2535]|uniref:proton-conducting transporter transmembrane domain-containing protein n=1 Tax=Pseudenhygromyxa sp. WMMC2535 TaxID=2712867 RepID=UPI001556562A|nr:proton-conducting transporter membrane subunit [Pseudenhygromyxa sp. WMMC2535]NVB42416.1 monovalent cation/H+ antiporter subunit D family protein [Pseudenhygromyxa sp. WMMC2535]
MTALIAGLAGLAGLPTWELQLSPMVAIAVPLIGAFLIAMADRWPNLREATTLVTAIALLWVVGNLTNFLGSAPSEPEALAEVVPGMPLAFNLEPLGMIYALIASSLWILNSIYSIGYMRGNNEKHQTRFYVCFALSIASVMGIAFAANMFTLFVFYEALSLATFPLVTHKGTPEALRSGRVYLGILMGTSVCLMLPAMIATYVYTGTLDFTQGGVFAQPLAEGVLTPGLFGLIFAMYVYGVGKAALMPAHRWLPAAMVAPTPVSALLHAVAVVKAGVFSVVKISVYIIGVDQLRLYGQGGWLVYVAGASIVIASFIALFQDNLKRRLAYSTISQLSYITLGAALLWPVSVKAAAMHIAAHAFGKITLFFAAGSIYTAAHKTKISELDGIGRKMPWTMGAFAVGTLSMIGLPPTGGFISKWFLMQGAWTAENGFAIAVLCTSTLLNAAYFLPIVYRAFLRAPPDEHAHDDEHDDEHAGEHADGHDEHGDHHDHGEAPLPIVFALTCTAAATVLLFFQPDLFAGYASMLAEAMPK